MGLLAYQDYEKLYAVRTDAAREAKMDILKTASELYIANQGKMLFDATASRTEVELTLRFPRPEDPKAEAKSTKAFEQFLIAISQPTA